MTTPRPSADILADILAALLRIEALMQREKVADSEVDWWVRRLSQPRPVVLPGAPEPPIAPVKPVTTWGIAPSPPNVKFAGTNCTDKAASPTPAADKANDPSLKQWRTPPAGYMHDGGWVHRDGFSMVGP